MSLLWISDGVWQHSVWFSNRVFQTAITDDDDVAAASDEFMVHAWFQPRRDITPKMEVRYKCVRY